MLALKLPAMGDRTGELLKLPSYTHLDRGDISEGRERFAADVGVVDG